MTALLLTATLATTTPITSWEADWHGRVLEAGGLTVGLVEDRRQFYALFDPAPEPIILPSVPRPVPPSVESWRPLVAEHFPAEHVDRALRVIACESGGNPNAANPTSSARGLFQFLRGWWSGVWGYPAFDPYDPAANVRAAAWLVYADGWHHWNASKGCWG